MASDRTSDTNRPVLVLFRHDLRLADNRALTAAARSGKPIVAAFVLDEESPGTRPPGGARRWWLHHSLEALAKSLSERGVGLVLRRGVMKDVALALADETGPDMVLWNRRYDPPAVAADTAMKAALIERNIVCESFDGWLLHEPWALKTGSGGPYKVYSPFWRALVQQGEPRDPLPRPGKLNGAPKLPKSDTLAAWALQPARPDWAGGLREAWTPGEAAAHKRLDRFLHGPVDGYGENRDRPGVDATSKLSPHLAHGEITPFQIWHATRLKSVAGAPADVEKFRKELAWREFSWHLLFHNPDLATRNYNAEFDGFRWRGGASELEAWRRGRTGYPIVDAGMRELWTTGWMHNRVRMVVASFLIKHLLVDWREGEAWFWDTLVDADAANNPASWQWVAGSGADAAPYFRIFNPVLQGAKFDADGDYVRRWAPELADLPDRFIHCPWDAPEPVKSEAGVKLGASWPVPLVDHAVGRDRAMKAYSEMRGNP